jgi:hypothetical protein
LITLIINSITTLALLSSLSQVESENIYLIMVIIEMYSYSLLTYTYIGLYLLGIKKISFQEFGRFRTGFIVFSVGVLAVIVTLVCIEIVIGIPCHE